MIAPVRPPHRRFTQPRPRRAVPGPRVVAAILCVGVGAAVASLLWLLSTRPDRPRSSLHTPNAGEGIDPTGPSGREADFADVPRFPGTSVQSAVVEGDSGMRRYVGCGSISDALAFYESRLPPSGWTRQPASGVGFDPAVQVSLWSREDARLSVAIAAVDDGLFIQVIREQVPEESEE